MRWTRPRNRDTWKLALLKQRFLNGLRRRGARSTSVWPRLRGELAHVDEEFRDAARNHALVFVLAAVGTGALVGWLFSRGRKQKKDRPTAELAALVAQRLAEDWAGRGAGADPASELGPERLARPIVVPGAGPEAGAQEVVDHRRG